ncbi:nucleotide pyrophosphohydrolase [Secundilactobacillus silagei]|uniref:nucleotide pyrophosphohydrolase n=1 Tax=Secundilactobacillus silagei TaxID=1293415 RepID=UPI000AC553AF|nr:nucleotide pyrophosphohydrolase [Secundilactobacillus silagei]
MDYEEISKALIKFRDERHWQKYHTLPALARAMSIEAAEVNEHFLWKDSQPDKELFKNTEDIESLKMEIADTLTYAYYMCEKLGVDPNDIVYEKLQINKKTALEILKLVRKYDYERGCSTSNKRSSV